MKRNPRSFAGAAALLLVSCAAVEPQPVPAPVAPEAPRPVVDAPAPGPAAPMAHPDRDALNLACDDGIELRVRFGEDEAAVEGLGEGRQILGRDAGGTGPQQSVYSGDRMRVEFGLGPGGTDADVHLLDSMRTLHCRRR
ncbi:hypothetical protein [Ramlibacter algicola]|uniref:C-type lysozyme inhibitor domain-containing protein n=1 Tax=Ramlibacter algicola TaxID=2795217 RepID=A0A934PY71_9BURK|nr:hypothetical protein [Ramlibacter algicola]MBK0391247.1 hypothetical protein [Ramlibacter algicola]